MNKKNRFSNFIRNEGDGDPSSIPEYFSLFIPSNKYNDFNVFFYLIFNFFIIYIVIFKNFYYHNY